MTPTARWRAAASLASALLVCGCANMVPDIHIPGFDVSVGPPSEGRAIDSATARAAALLPPVTPSRTPLGPGSTTLQALTGRNTIINAPELSRYAEGIIDRLAKGWPGKKPPIQVFVTSESLYNAQATPDGDILVSFGAFRDTEDEAEIAALLAHETSHVLLHHYERNKTRDLEEQALETAGTYGTATAKLADLKVRKYGNRITAQQANSKDYKEHIVAIDLVNLAGTELIGTLVDPQWSRFQEDWADTLGLDLMVKAGYDPSGMIVMLERIRSSAMEMEGRAEKLAQEKGDAIQAHLVVGDLQQAMDELISAGTELIVAGAEQTRAQLQQLHANAEKRMDNVRDYIGREYADDSDGELRSLQWTQVRNRDRVRGTIDNHALAFEAFMAMNKQDFGRGMGLAGRSNSYPTSDAAYTRYAAFSIKRARGDLDGAIGEMDRVAGGEILSFGMQSERIETLLDMGREQQAKQALAAAERQSGQPEIYYPLRIAVHLAEDNRGAAQETYDKCMKLDTSSQRKACDIRMNSRRVTTPATTLRSASAGGKTGAGLGANEDEEKPGVMDRFKSWLPSKLPSLTTLAPR
jgi:predicted Zn-dependent protease